MVTVTVNGSPIAAHNDETLLELLGRTGTTIPTLCHIAGLEPSGSCRLCVVESVDTGKLITACTTLAEEGMSILTHSPRVIDARRTNLELLLSHHADDCLYCARADDCRIRALAAELGLSLRRFGTVRREARLDKTAPGLLRDPSKCILCGRCIRICEEVQSVSAIDFTRRGRDLAVGTPFDARLAETPCIRCGQCLVACPTGAIADNFEPDAILAALADPEKIVTISVEPGVVAPFAARWKTGADTARRLASALRMIGFDRIFDTATSWRGTVAAVARELLQRNAPGPLLLPFCPAAGRFIREHLPHLASQLSSGVAPRVRQGAAIKSTYAKEIGFPPETLFTVTATPCLAARDEAFETPPPAYGPDIDMVLTARDLAHLFDLFHIDPSTVDPAPFDRDFGPGDPDAAATGRPGEFAAAVAFSLRPDAVSIVEARPLPGVTIHRTDEFEPLRWAVVAGLGATRRFLTDTTRHNDIHFIEIDACPGGCLHGGGVLDTERA